MDANNITTDTISHASNTQRENANLIFPGEKLDKSYELVDAVKQFTINDAKYYDSNTATTSDAQGDLTCYLDAVTHTSNWNEIVIYTSNRIFEQNLLFNWTIPVSPLEMNTGIDQVIVPIILSPQTLLEPAKKKFLRTRL